MTDDVPVDELQERAALLPRTLQPDARVWQRVEAGLSADRSPVPSLGGRTSRRTLTPTLKYGWPIAALTLLGIAVATLSFNATQPQPTVAAWQPDPIIQTQVHQLLDAQLDELPKDVRTTVLDNLAIIASAREEIRQALEENPSNQLLQSLYLNSYANERTLLKDVESMTRRSVRRTQL